MPRPPTRWLIAATVSLLGLGALAAPIASADPPVPSAVTGSALPLLPAPPPPGQVERGRKAKERFDRKAPQAPADVVSWGVDETTGKMTVEVVGTPSPAAARFVADSDPGAVVVRTGAAPIRPFADLVGGQAINSTAGERCSIGASVRNGAGKLFVLTAGHCTESQTRWSGFNRQDIGPVRSSNYPKNDFGAIEVANVAGWQGTARVQGGPTVKGTTEAAIDDGVCRSGSTTGYRCGTIQAKNATVNYGGGDVVYGLTRTNACAEPGDSGGSFITPAGQLQGVTSGGSGNCTQGGSTFFQPVNPALSAYRMTVVTG